MLSARSLAALCGRLARRTAVGASLFLAGILTGAALTASAKDVPYGLLEVFASALSEIEERYVVEREPVELIYDAIGGLTQGLDDHSLFYEPDDYAELKENTRGEYYGVGISVEVRETRVFIVTPLEGSPAEQAGLQAGDEIVAVDGVRVSEAQDEDVLGRIRGLRGTAVLITVLREGAEQDIRVMRDRVRTRSVEHKLLDGGRAWLRIERFQVSTADEVKRALVELEEANGADLTGIVVDLRDNPGGYLSQAVQVADLWIRDGTIVSTISRAPRADNEVARAPGTDTKTPIVVLVDGGSASAAEILAGALQDHGRASLVGYTTYGKGSVQQHIDLPDGSGLKLTIARYLTPSGRSIHGSGIRPDVALGERDEWRPWKDPGPILDGKPAPNWVVEDTNLHLAFAALDDPEGVAGYFRKASASAPEAAEPPAE